MGEPLDIEPHEALIVCVQITAGEVAYCTRRIMELNTTEYVGHPESYVEEETTGGEHGGGTKDVTKKGAPELNIWINARAACMDRLARFSKMALDAGVDERRVRLAENMASQLAPVLQAIFKELGLTAKQKGKAPEIVERHLMTLETTSAFEVNGVNGN